MWVQSGCVDVRVDDGIGVRLGAGCARLGLQG